MEDRGLPSEFSQNNQRKGNPIQMLKPIQDMVLIEPLMMSREARVGSIFMPTNSNNKSKSEGIVRGMGPGSERAGGGRYEMDIKVGDIVLFESTTKQGHVTIQELKDDGKDYYLMNYEQLVAVREI